MSLCLAGLCLLLRVGARHGSCLVRCQGTIRHWCIANQLIFLCSLEGRGRGNPDKVLWEGSRPRSLELELELSVGESARFRAHLQRGAIIRSVTQGEYTNKLVKMA